MRADLPGSFSNTNMVGKSPCLRTKFRDVSYTDFVCVMVHLVNGFTRLTVCPRLVGRRMIKRPANHSQYMR